ncbi:trna/rrna methyltransferase spou type [Lucifera butyrica]|uniref:Trna/rrna methyltransferase spou type n=1 Tax=Lucifera butyrica TaxID=1351585 RepID=A0A498RF93_9FIRM|nr:RNA methyltransferase [Lucifera butyrica]VBB08763.1 trna/rrna methyltransferase spou type [Lucifera butyrica]
MAEQIISPQNPLVKMAASLKQKKNRDKYGLFAVEGSRLAEEALKSGWPVEYCFFTAEDSQNERAGKIIEMLQSRSCRMLQISRSLYDKISDTEQGQGVILLIKKRQADIKAVFNNKETSLLIVLDELQDPGNVGTVIRTADAAGCDGVILTPGCADLFSGKTIRASMGSLFHLPVVEAMPKSAVISMLREKKIKLAATALNDADIYFEADLRDSLAIILGNEGQGVSDEMLSAAAVKLHIPLYGQAESLNVAASAAVILYEAARQRRVNL